MTDKSIAAVPHVHAEVIKAWADGAQIEYRTNSDDEWEGIDTPHFNGKFQYRIKPELPEKVYPVTQMTYEEITRAYNDTSDLNGLVGIANAALRHAIDANQIITTADHQDALITLGENLRGVEIARHADRDIAIAQAAHKAALVNANAYSGGLHAHLLGSIDLITIIAGVHP